MQALRSGLTFFLSSFCIQFTMFSYELNINKEWILRVACLPNPLYLLSSLSITSPLLVLFYLFSFFFFSLFLTPFFSPFPLFLNPTLSSYIFRLRTWYRYFNIPSSNNNLSHPSLNLFISPLYNNLNSITIYLDATFNGCYLWFPLVFKILRHYIHPSILFLHLLYISMTHSVIIPQLLPPQAFSLTPIYTEMLIYLP